MVVLCHTVQSRSKEQPSRNIRKGGRNLLLGRFVDLYDIQACRQKVSARISPNTQVELPGGRLCFSFSAFSLSSSDRVYR